MNISWHRVYAVILRHLLNFIHNYDRLVDAFYWPSVDIVIWGLTISAIEKADGGTRPYYIPMIVCAIILWYVLWRGQGEIAIGVLEEFWSENLANLFSTPLTFSEWVIGMLSFSLIKLAMTLSATILLGFLLYSVNIFSFSPVLILLIGSLLLTGWAFGFFLGGLFLRFGTNIQTLAWAGSVVLMPFSATYYPLSTLPAWVQAIANVLPSSYVFEGMRLLIHHEMIPVDMLVKSYALNGLYLMMGALFFVGSFRHAMKHGLDKMK